MLNSTSLLCNTKFEIPTYEIEVPIDTNESDTISSEEINLPKNLLKELQQVKVSVVRLTDNLDNLMKKHGIRIVRNEDNQIIRELQAFDKKI